MEDGTQLKRMEDIRNKSDVTVKAVDGNGDALLCVRVEGRPLEGVMMHGKALEVAKEKVDVTVKAVDGNGEGSLVEKFKKEGNTLWVQGRPLEAVMMYGKALEVATEKADVAVLHCNRALVYLKLEMWDEAVADAQMATSLDPGNVKACFRWGQGLFGQGKFLEAQRVLGEALDIEAITNQQALEVGLLIAKCEKMGGPDKAADAVDVASARTARLPVSVYVRLKPYYAIAIQAMEENRWAHAIAIYQKVLEIYPNDYTSLLGLGSCLLRNKSHRYVEAVEVLKRLCSAHGTEASFEAWRMLGEAQHGAGLLPDALESYGEAAKYSSIVEEGWSEEEKSKIIDWRTKDLKVQAARTLAAQNKHDIALHFVSQILSADEAYVPALTEYVELMIDYKKAYDEAVKASVKALTLAPKDRSAKRLFCRAVERPGMVTVLLNLLGKDIPATGLAFLASIAKEYSAIPAAVQLFQGAAKKDPHNPGHCLSVVHTQEVLGDYQGALSTLRAWFQSNSSFQTRAPATGKTLVASEVLLAWDSTAPASSGPLGALLRETESLGNPDWASPSDLDFLALCFVLVKILFLQGAFGRIPAIVRLVESIRERWDFHTTSIRNEQAYYCCAAQCVEWHSVASDLPLLDRGHNIAESIFVIGDSHSLPCSWTRVDESVVLEPRLVTGCKMWHLREDGTFFPKYNFTQAIRSIPMGSSILVILGEIDCREGLLVCVEKGRYDSLESGVETVVNIFIRCILGHIVERKFNSTFIHPVIPVLDATRHIVEIFNSIYKREVEKHSPQLTWLNFYDKLVVPIAAPESEKIPDCHSSWKLNPKYALDGTHLNPSYVQDCLAPALLHARSSK